MRYRIERDSLGERQVPAEAYYGIETLRGKENFEITKRGICRPVSYTHLTLPTTSRV